MRWPRKCTLAGRKRHFVGLSVRPAFWRASSTSRKLSLCSCVEGPKTIILSKYTRHLYGIRERSTRNMRRWKVAAALQSPKGRVWNSNNPSSTGKAVLWRSLGWILNCQYPSLRSSVEHQAALPSAPRVSSKHGSGNKSRIVTAFRR
uniref:Transposon Ty3-G Gag-Pol polyprotein n=1 Tax=Schistocephalus solidus TaxID=70667 RepID=A0A0X3Q0F8_SCHSO